MQLPLMTVVFRVLAVTFSLSMLGGYVWFSQRKALPVAAVSSATAAPPAAEFDEFVNYGAPIEVASLDASGEPRTIILGTKNINQPIFSTRKVQEAVSALKSASGPADTPPTSPWVMSGSKSFTGATTIVADQLELSSILRTPSKVVESNARTMMPGSKRSSGVITPDSVDDLLAAVALEPRSAGPAVMPGSKISHVFVAAAAHRQKPAPPEKVEMKRDGSQSGIFTVSALTGFTVAAGSRNLADTLRDIEAQITSVSCMKVPHESRSAETTHGNAPAPGDKPEMMMSGLNSRPVSLTEPYGITTPADRHARVFRISSDLAAAPDGAGILVMSPSLEPRLAREYGRERLARDVAKPQLPPAIPIRNTLMLSGSKTASAVVAPSSRFDSSIRWDLDEAMRDIEAQVTSVFSLKVPHVPRAVEAQRKERAPAQKPMMMMPGSKSGPVSLSEPSGATIDLQPAPVTLHSPPAKLSSLRDATGSLHLPQTAEPKLPADYGNPGGIQGKFGTAFSEVGEKRAMLLSGSKSASAVMAPASPFAVGLRWDFAEAVREIETQISLGFGLEPPPSPEKPTQWLGSESRATGSTIPSVNTPPAPPGEEVPQFPPSVPANEGRDTPQMQPAHLKPLSLSGNFGPIEAKPDDAGNLVLAKPLQPRLRGNFGDERVVSESGFSMQAAAMLGPHATMSPGSKAALVVPPPRVDAAWFTWDLGKAVDDLTRQIRSGFMPIEPSLDANSIMLPANPMRAPSVLALPDSHASAPKP